MNTLKAEKRDMSIKEERDTLPVMYLVKRLKALSLLNLRNPQ